MSCKASGANSRRLLEPGSVPGSAPQSPADREIALACPQCGRILQIPFSKKDKAIVCKGCLHILKLNASANALRSKGIYQPARQSAGRQPGQGAPQSQIPRARLVRGISIAISAALLLGLLTLIYTSQFAPKTAKEDEAPHETMEEIRNALKSLAE